MKNILTKSLYITIIGTVLTGCAIKSKEINEIQPKVNELTKKANIVFKSKDKQINEIEPYLTKKYPLMMKEFEGYDIRFDYKNNITIVLICKNDKVLFEDLSCNDKIDNNYTKENLPCNYYIEYPSCK